MPKLFEGGSGLLDATRVRSINLTNRSFHLPITSTSKRFTARAPWLEFKVVPFQDLNFLAHFRHTRMRKHPVKDRSRIDEAIATQNGAGIYDGVTSHFRSIANNRAKFRQAGCDVSVRSHSRKFLDGPILHSKELRPPPDARDVPGWSRRRS